MPDITMCQNNLCALRDRCYRFTAKPDGYYQLYSMFQPRIRFKDKTGIIDCEHFLTIQEESGE